MKMRKEARHAVNYLNGDQRTFSRIHDIQWGRLLPLLVGLAGMAGVLMFLGVKFLEFALI